jgi:hypothetical protein
MLSNCDWIIRAAALLIEYPLTLGSLATSIHKRLLMRPIPVTMPPDFTSSLPYSSCPAKLDSYKKGLPGSSIF